MTVYVLDTTTLTHIQEEHPRVLERLAAAVDVGASIGTTTVNVEEVVGGWFAKLRQAKSPAQEARAAHALALAVRALGRLAIHHTTEPALDRFDALVRMKLNVGRSDLKIAAVALDLGATVVTDNLRDFGRVPHLAVENWLV
jgi:tRNA(fMet)-specific endonuclease VapC